MLKNFVALVLFPVAVFGQVPFQDSLDLDPSLTVEQKTLARTGKLPLIRYIPAANSQFLLQPDGNRDQLISYPRPAEYLSFYRGGSVLPFTSLNSFLGSSDLITGLWLPGYTEPDPTASVKKPSDSVFPLFGSIAFGVTLVASAVVISGGEANARRTDPKYQTPGIMYGLAFGVSGLAGFLGLGVDYVIQSPFLASSKAKYEEEVAEAQRNAPPPETQWPENIANMTALEKRMREYNRAILQEPKYAMLQLPAGTPMQEVVKMYGEPQSLRASDGLIRAEYSLVGRDVAVLEYTLAAVLLTVKLK